MGAAKANKKVGGRKMSTSRKINDIDQMLNSTTEDLPKEVHSNSIYNQILPD